MIGSLARIPRLGALLLAVAIAQFTTGESFAQASPVYAQCAVEAYATGVIMTANAINNAALVNQDAAACTNLIGSGEWFGVDKYGSWKAQGYVRVCEVTINVVESLDVWGIYGDPTSAVAAVYACQGAQDNGQFVRWRGSPGI